MRERWYDNYLKVYGKAYDGAAYVELAASIREKIARLQSPHPLVTVSVIGYNEEKHLLACLWALSEMKTRYPIEIIGVDNDSQDKTAEIFQATGVPYFVEKHHSCGSARLCGLRHARGKYHINIDSDTLYPPSYVDCMADVLERDPKVVGVNGTWGYFPTPHTPVWQLWMYEKMRNAYLRMQAIRRPELSVRGLVFAYRTKEALEVGIRTHIIRGEDGALALGLKKLRKKVREVYDDEDDEDENDTIFAPLPVLEEEENPLLNALTEDEKRLFWQKNTIENTQMQQTAGKMEALHIANNLAREAGLKNISRKALEAGMQEAVFRPEQMQEKVIKKEVSGKLGIKGNMEKGKILEAARGIKKVERLGGKEAAKNLDMRDIIKAGEEKLDEIKLAELILEKSGQDIKKRKKRLQEGKNNLELKNFKNQSGKEKNAAPKNKEGDLSRRGSDLSR